MADEDCDDEARDEEDYDDGDRDRDRDEEDCDDEGGDDEDCPFLVFLELLYFWQRLILPASLRPDCC